jgi:quercetin dioxygenase-like cupin family protein
MEVTHAQRIDKPWGHELLWALTGSYAGKILHVRAGECLSRQFHITKDEYQYVLSGQVVVELGEQHDARCRTLVEGEGLHIPAGLVHRLLAISDATVLEVSTPELDDVVRLEDDYGRVGHLVASGASETTVEGYSSLNKP